VRKGTVPRRTGRAPLRAAYHLPGYLPPARDGCSVSPSCLVCPLPECIYAVVRPANERRVEASQAKYRTILQALAEGKTRAEAARLAGVSQSTVRRAVAFARQQRREGGHAHA
jgi:hypothetical protein